MCNTKKITVTNVKGADVIFKGSFFRLIDIVDPHYPLKG
jgi:hypothetical protein